MILTTEQLAILAHVVTDPQVWADHAEATLGEEVVLAKIEKYRPEWGAQKDLPGYKTKAERDVIPVATVPPIIVTPRQIRQALTRFNLRTQVGAAVAAGDQDTKDWWEFATQFEENHPMVVGMAQTLNVSDTDLHNLFVLAKSL